MKTLRAPAVLLVLAFIVLAASLLYGAGQLPNRVATHFGFDGRPNGWMSRSSHLRFMAGFGFGLPLALVALGLAARYLPAGLINLPHREYWLAPERRDAAFHYLIRHLFWLACLAAMLMAGLHLLLILANRQPSPQLSNSAFFALLGGFLAGVVAWVISLAWHFSRTPPAKES